MVASVFDGQWDRITWSCTARFREPATAVRYEECSREGQSSIGLWYRFRRTRGGAVHLASSRYEGVVDTFV